MFNTLNLNLRLFYFLGIQVYELPDIDNELIIKNVKHKEAINADSAQDIGVSHFGNHGGWDVDLFECKEADKLKNSVQEILKVTHGAFLYDDHWIHFVKPGEKTIPHNHGELEISFCYFLNSPKNSGKFKFSHKSKDFKFEYSFEPRIGELFIFPSYLFHEASVNESNEIRYSFAGNCWSNIYTNHSKEDEIYE